MTRKHRWKARIVGGILAVCGTTGMTGCKQQMFLEPADWKEAIRPEIPASLETSPHDPIVPASAISGTSPATVLDPKRLLRPISLKEAIAIAIEQGNIGIGGQGGFQNAGSVNDSLPQFQGRNVSGTDSIRALVLDPAVQAAEIERSLSKFDARFTSSLTWGKQDQATLNLQQSFSNGDTFQFSSTIAKPLPSGGLAGITTSMNYLNLSTPPPANSGFVTLNSSYQPRVQFIFEQPLLQGFGVETNQLTTAHPGSVLIPGLRPSGGQGSEGILITRIRNEQARQSFDVSVNQMLLNVEAAYWNLYSAYYNLYAQEEAVKQSLAGVQFLKQRNVAGIDPPFQLPQAESQYWGFRQQMIAARGQVLSADRAFRGLLGMKSDDGTIFRPTDEPTEAKFKPDFYALYSESLQNRPELILARQDVKSQQLNLELQKNQRMPDLRVGGFYDVNGLGARLNGGPDVNALANLASNQFNSWQMFVRFDMPIGFRDANALVRQGQLGLWRSFTQLQDAERKAYEVLVDAFRRMDESYATIQVARAGRLATEKLVNGINDRVNAGSYNSQEYINLLQGQRDLARATSDEYRAIAQYNTALAQIEFAKGTIQQYNSVSVADGPLPNYVQKKAADHFRAQSLAIKIREHPAILPLKGLDTYQMLNPSTLPEVSPSAPLPGGIVPQPIVIPAPIGQAAPGTVIPSPLSSPVGSPVSSLPQNQMFKTWDSWQGAPPPGTVTQTTEGTSGTFTPIGTVNFPAKRTAVPSGVPNR